MSLYTAAITLFLVLDPIGNIPIFLSVLGDLDDFFWPSTTWYGRREDRELRDIVLVYSGQTVPTVIGEGEQPDGLRGLLAEIAPHLPQRFHAHLSPGVEPFFQDTHTIRPHGGHYRMTLRDSEGVSDTEDPKVVAMGPAHLSEALVLYQQSYPENWFDARMLETGRYYGLWDAGQMVSVAGVHVYPRRYRVAALGNIATHPAHRGKGYGTRVTAHLCRTLRDEVDHIRLNVKADNVAAIRCYQRLGFEIVARYAEFDLERKIQVRKAVRPF